MDIFETASAVEALYNRSIDVVSKLRTRGDVSVEGMGEADEALTSLFYQPDGRIGRANLRLNQRRREGWSLAERAPDPVRSKSWLHPRRSKCHANGLRH